TIRWGISLIAVLEKNIYLFLAIWIAGSVISNAYNLAAISRKMKSLIRPSFDFSFLFRHFKESLSLYLSNSTSFLSSQGDRVTTSYLLGSYYLGLYQFSALVAGVPYMFISSISGSLLSASSFYKALGKEEVVISSISFKFIALLTFVVAIASFPLAKFLIPILFPEYVKSVNVLTLLILVMTLPIPVGMLTNFIIAFKRSLRPFLYLTLITASTVLLTSFLLIPRLGIMGGAISQLISSLISSSFILYYATSTKVFLPTLKEFVVLLMLPSLGLFEYFADPLWLDVIVLLIVLMVFKVFRVISRDEARIVNSFLPKWLKFLEYVVVKISS
ncbi:oligosaccharide flippase family protein, partial [Acidianus sp. RZ1]|uniref:oligosaccharide flippase family protein n=1 Tax=Acidianus sp. RZ1 TaxID=1540082 RepID=UPI001491E4E5